MTEHPSSRVQFNERLIYEVEQRPSLWDSRSPKNRNVVLKSSDWRKVAAALNCSEKKVQSRWKNLRDTFQRRLRDLRSSDNPGASPEDSMTCIRWTYFTKMLFLKDAVEGRMRAADVMVWTEPSQDLDGTVQLPLRVLPPPPPIAAAPPLVPAPASLPDDDDIEECITCEVGSPVQSSTVEVCSSPAASSEWERQRVSPEPSTAAIVTVDRSTASEPSFNAGQGKRKLDDWDHFLLSLKRHLSSTPSHLVGSAQMHLLQIAVTYGSGRTPRNLMPLTDLF